MTGSRSVRATRLRVLLRELAVCIWGEDPRPGLPRTRPSAAVAAGFHSDAHVVLAGARQTLASSTDPEVIRRVCRMVPRRMVQVAFAVVMARDGVWATVLEEQAAAVGATFLQWAEAARRAAEQGRRPVADADVVRHLLDTFGRWAEDTFDQAFRAASNLDLASGWLGRRSRCRYTSAVGFCSAGSPPGAGRGRASHGG